MADDSYQEKTEQPTEKRIKDARDKGQVAQSPEIGSCFVILFLAVFLYYAMSKGFDKMFLVYTSYIRNMGLEITEAGITDILSCALTQWTTMVVPVFALLLALGLFASFIQTGFMWSIEALTPKLTTLNPLTGIKNLFSRKSLLEALKSVIKIVVLCYMVYHMIVKDLPVIISLGGCEPSEIMAYVLKMCFNMTLKIGVAFLFIAGLDYLRQRWQQRKDLMMSRQDVKDEYKEREGNPLVKSRMRSLQRGLSRRRMIQDVKKADVVVTNPTTYAVAISYVAREMAAPRVVAKGAGFIAERIKEEARRHGVTIIENKPVARALFFAVKVGDFIPEKFYQIVAELLAQVYRHKNRVTG